MVGFEFVVRLYIFVPIGLELRNEFGEKKRIDALALHIGTNSNEQEVTCVGTAMQQPSPKTVGV